jgi:hypothetical protein
VMTPSTYGMQLPAHVASLSLRARQIHADLVTAIEQKKGGNA